LDPWFQCIDYMHGPVSSRDHKLSHSDTSECDILVFIAVLRRMLRVGIKPHMF